MNTLRLHFVRLVSILKCGPMLFWKTVKAIHWNISFFSNILFRSWTILTKLAGKISEIDYILSLNVVNIRVYFFRELIYI